LDVAGSRRGLFSRAVFSLAGAAVTAIACASGPERKSWPRFSALAGLMPVLYGLP